MSRAVDDNLEMLTWQVANEFFDRLARGESPTIEEYQERYPEIADLIRHAFPALQYVSDSMSGGLSGEPMP